MLSRDSLRVLRRLALRPSEEYVCSACSAKRSRSHSTTSRHQSNYGGRLSISKTAHHARYFHHGKTLLEQSSLTSSTTPLDDASLQSGAALFGKNGDVREYLKNWNSEYQANLKANAPDQVTQVGRQILLPNALFARNNLQSLETETDREAYDDTGDVETLGDQSAGLDADEPDGASSYAKLVEVGDLFTIKIKGVREQLAVCIGQVGAQYQYLLENGSWFMHTQGLHSGFRLANFLSDEELEAIRAVLPQRTVEKRDLESGAVTPHRAQGEVPPAILAPFVKKFAAFQEDLDSCRRKYGRLLDDAYNALAYDTTYAHTSLADMVREVTQQESESLSNAENFFLREKIDLDERFVPDIRAVSCPVFIMPRSFALAIKDVVSWTRAYQDAAARAAAGKDVFQELKENPLTAFISKARRLISKSRMIRSPTPSGFLSSTFKHLAPQGGQIERKTSGESFTETDRKIITVLFHSNVKKPQRFAENHTRAACTLILRAVGAYPNVDFSRAIAVLFLQELGCLDPWHFREAFNMLSPDYRMGLVEKPMTLKAKEREAVANLHLEQLSPGEMPFPDSMAHLRKDWGDTIAYTIDKDVTWIRDDAISLEAAHGMPGHFWIHAHMAHPSAYIPFDHVFVQRALHMNNGLYDKGSMEPYFPTEILERLTISPGKPISVLTCSTLLDMDGNVKDIKVLPGTLRNIVKLDLDLVYEREKRPDHPPTRVDTLLVGSADAKKRLLDRGVHALAKDESAKRERRDLVTKHAKTLDQMHSLLIARWDARRRENPGLEGSLYTSGHAYVQVSDAPLSDKNIDRLYRSEFCYGEPALSVSFVSVPNATFLNPAMKYDLVGSAMTLAAESWSRWLHERNVPAIHRQATIHPSYGIDKLNSLKKHEGGVMPIPSLGLRPTLMPEYAATHSAPVQNPLRRAADLINHYQTDAFIKAEADVSLTKNKPKSIPTALYPMSSHDVTKYLEGYDPGLSSRLARHADEQLAMWAIFRAATFDEGILPSIFDATLANPIQLGQSFVRADMIYCSLPFLGLEVALGFTEQGFEKQAKFGQFLPIKITSFSNTSSMTLQGLAVGPPSDTPYTQSLYGYDKHWDDVVPLPQDPAQAIQVQA